MKERGGVMESENESGRIPPELTTPITIFGEIVGGLLHRTSASPDAKQIDDELFSMLQISFKDDESGDSLSASDRLQELCAWEQEARPDAKDSTVVPIFVMFAYCRDAVAAWKEDRISESWRLICEAKYWHGCIVGTMTAPKGAAVFSEHARRAANKRHEPNRELQTKAVEWYLTNRDKFPSKDAAAEHIAGSVVPRAFRTVRSWLSGL